MSSSVAVTGDPTPKDAAKPGKETVDYASKHWAGLIKDYYAERVKVVQRQAMYEPLPDFMQEQQPHSCVRGCRSASAAGKELDAAAVDKGKAALAWQWTTSQALYPTTAVGDALAVSRKMHEKYRSHFATCE